MSDDFEGSIGERRTIVYTLTFTMKIAFYGPVSDSKLIREVNNNLYILSGDSDREDFQYRMALTPTPSGVSVDSDYGFSFTYYDSAL